MVALSATLLAAAWLVHSLLERTRLVLVVNEMGRGV